MNDPWMLALVIVLFALQLFLCAKARRVWLRLLYRHEKNHSV